MLFVVRFSDASDSQKIREQHLLAHIAWLAERHRSILVAGSLRDRPASKPVGALWIVDANSKSEVTALYQSDPFWIQGLRDRVEILHWSKAFPDSRTPV